MSTRLILIIFCITAVVGTSGYFAWLYFKSLSPLPMQPVTLTTADGVTIAGNYLAPEHPKGAVLLLHMMPATKESWAPLQQTLGRAGIASFAIDLRGHGGSTHGPADIRLNYQSFNDEEHQLSRNDVMTGVSYLTEHGFAKHTIVLMGASIGANLALQHLSQDPEIRGALLLSPGLDFHGIETEQYTHSLANNQALYTIASRDDGYSFESSRKLYDLAAITQKEIGEYEGIGHGTAMIENKPELIDVIVEWLAKQFE